MLIMEPVATIKMFSATIKVFNKDRLVKFIGVPVFAISIVNYYRIITKFVIILCNFYKLCLLYSLAWIIWEGNVRLIIFLKKISIYLLNAYYKSILILYGFIILYTVFIATGGFIYGWNFSNENNIMIKRFICSNNNN